MHLIEIIYTLGVAVSISAALPQVRQLVVSKASDEFSLITWGVWLGTQFVSLLYTISIGNLLLIGSNTLWVSFYAVMVYLIVHYRHFRRVEVAEVLAGEA